MGWFHPWLCRPRPPCAAPPDRRYNIRTLPVRLSPTPTRGSVAHGHILAREDLPFPQFPPDFQRVFPDDAACAASLEKARWEGGVACPWCGVVGGPFRFEARPGVLRCRACRKDVGLMAGTVMERSHTPLSIWFWTAYAFPSPLGIAGEAAAPTFDGLYSGEWAHSTSSGCG
jgi:hypothetical protein